MARSELSTRREFDNRKHLLPDGREVTIGFHQDETGEMAIKVRMPGSWKIESAFPGGNVKPTIVTLTRQK